MRRLGGAGVLSNGLVSAVAALTLASCGDSTQPEDACTPACDARACGDDGCGQPCGTCGPGDTCSADGLCEPADPCDRSCEELQLACGDHCGRSCGTCADDQACSDGVCVCDPTCLGKTCGDPDGCTGTCEPCAADENCADCSLRLRVVEREVVGGQLAFVTLALDFHPPDGATLPGIADVRLRVEGPARLVRVGLGEAPTESGKEPHIDPATGQPFHELADGSLRILLLSTESTASIGAGRWLLLRFRLGAVGRPARMPVVVSLIEREEILAPPLADQVLWGGGYAEPVVVWPEVTDGP